LNARRDQVAGGIFVAAGLFVLAVSRDLPFGTLSSPGAGMLPMLLVALTMAFGLMLFFGGGKSPPIAEIGWGDFPHALRVIALAAAAVTLYVSLGFLLTMGALLFLLTFAVERRPFVKAAAFSIGVTALAYVLFSMALKTPVPRGLFGF
jgi:hypothetical protein